MKYLFFAFLSLSFSARSQPNHLVISQVYGGGGNTGAVFSNDFIEIFNPGTQAIDLNGFSLQYSSAAGSTWSSLIALAGIIPAKKYYLIQLAGGANGNALPTPDQTAAFNLSATSGKIALVNSIVPLTGTCPLSGILVDFLGYGAASCSEGQPAGQGSSTLAQIRKSGGCLDTENNSVDFISGTPAPRNTGSSMNDCTQLNSSLPIYFSNEKGRYSNGKLELSWTNDSEFEVESYIIEASDNGNLFEAVQTINPEKNDGTSIQYSIRIDSTAKIFYRIRGKEWNGNITYSNIIKVNLTFSGEAIRLFPNPVGNELSLEISGFKKGSYLLSILNDAGIRVSQKLVHNAGRTIIKIPVSQLHPGIYFLHLDGKTAAKFIKY